MGLGKKIFCAAVSSGLVPNFGGNGFEGGNAMVTEKKAKAHPKGFLEPHNKENDGHFLEMQPESKAEEGKRPSEATGASRWTSMFNFASPLGMIFRSIHSVLSRMSARLRGQAVDQLQEFAKSEKKAADSQVAEERTSTQNVEDAKNGASPATGHAAGTSPATSVGPLHGELVASPPSAAAATGEAPGQSSAVGKDAKEEIAKEAPGSGTKVSRIEPNGGVSSPEVRQLDLTAATAGSNAESVKGNVGEAATKSSPQSSSQETALALYQPERLGAPEPVKGAEQAGARTAAAQAAGASGPEATVNADEATSAAEGGESMEVDNLVSPAVADSTPKRVVPLADGLAHGFRVNTPEVLAAGAANAAAAAEAARAHVRDAYQSYPSKKPLGEGYRRNWAWDHSAGLLKEGGGKLTADATRNAFEKTWKESSGPVSGLFKAGASGVGTGLSALFYGLPGGTGQETPKTGPTDSTVEEVD